MSMSKKEQLELLHHKAKLDALQIGDEYRIAECEETIERLTKGIEERKQKIAEIEARLQGE